MYDLIYCNGDSFAAGMDLAEDTYFPDLEGYAWHEWKEHQDANVDAMLRMHKTKGPTWWPEVEKLQRERAFAHQLSMLTGIPSKNKARSGAGFTKITMTTFENINRYLQKEPNLKIAAFIFFTNPQRLWWPRSTAAGRTDKADTLVLGGYLRFKEKIEQKVVKHYIRNATYEQWAIQLGLTYLGLYTMLKQLGVDVYFVGTPLLDHSHFDEYRDEGFGRAVEIFKENYIGTLGGHDIQNRKKDKIFTTGGHLRPEEHYNLAVDVKNKLGL